MPDSGDLSKLIASLKALFRAIFDINQIQIEISNHNLIRRLVVVIS